MIDDNLVRRLKFNDDGLIPAIVQDAGSGDVRMLGYMNQEALVKTVQTGFLHFWSRSRQQLWMKGETSGHVHHVREIRHDCDGDTLLVKVLADGPTCHLGNETCFDGDALALVGEVPVSSKIVDQIAAVIADRSQNPVDGSYTSYLLREGVDKIGKKIGEEAAEVIIAAKNADSATIAAEASDLIYHLLVLLQASGVPPHEVWDVLSTRRGRPAPDHPSQ